MRDKAENYETHLPTESVASSDPSKKLTSDLTTIYCNHISIHSLETMTGFVDPFLLTVLTHQASPR
jgi:hypothetical protein